MCIDAWWTRLKALVRGPAPLRAEPRSPEEPQPSRTSDEGYRADQPIRNREEDRFNRWPFAKRIAETIGRREDPSSLVIGIYGVWGDGKTSTLQLMEEALHGHDRVVVVRFNPWHFESEEQLIRGFFETLADALGRSLPTKREEFGRLLSRYGTILSVASVSLLGGVAQITPGGGLKELGQTLSTVEIDELRRRLERLLAESGKRIAVFLDDIDRLDRQEIQAVFKLVKLSAGFEHTVYVLAFDDEVVAAALGERYGAGGAAAGRSFLEKIIQVPLHLPPADRLALRRLTLGGVDAALRLAGIELRQEQAQAFVHHFVEGLERRLTTPRQAKRYANALTFALPILKGEVHPVDQMLVEGIRIFYPKLYPVIRENPDIFLTAGREGRREEEARKRAREVIEKGLEGLDPAELGAAKDLLQTLFPRLKGVFGNTVYGPDWDERWAREQRVCSENYFHRYFHYGVPPADVPDSVISILLGRAEAGDEAAVAETLRQHAERGAAPRLVAKLRLVEDVLDRAVAARLALMMAHAASCLPREKTLFGFDSTFSQAAILAMKLVKRLPAGGDRENLAREIIRDANPLTFAVECFRWLRSDEKELEPERLLPVAVEEELGGLLAGRIREAAQAQPPYIAWPDESPSLLWLWTRYGPEGEARAYLQARFTGNPTEAVRFLTTYVPTAWGGESGLPHKSDFMRDGYDGVAKIIDPEVIARHLASIYGAELESDEYHLPRDMPLETRVARQFAYIHRKVTASKDNPQAHG